MHKAGPCSNILKKDFNNGDIRNRRQPERIRTTNS